jgi:hypothetical protein
VRGYIQNIPQSYRDMALEQIKEGVQSQMDMLPEEGENLELQESVIKNQIRQWEAIFNEMDYIQLGWNTDQSNKKVAIDTRVVAIEDQFRRLLSRGCGGQHANRRSDYARRYRSSLGHVATAKNETDDRN